MPRRGKGIAHAPNRPIMNSGNRELPIQPEPRAGPRTAPAPTGPLPAGRTGVPALPPVRPAAAEENPLRPSTASWRGSNEPRRRMPIGISLIWPTSWPGRSMRSSTRNGDGWLRRLTRCATRGATRRKSARSSSRPVSTRCCARPVSIAPIRGPRSSSKPWQRSLIEAPSR